MRWFTSLVLLSTAILVYVAFHDPRATSEVSVVRIDAPAAPAAPADDAPDAELLRPTTRSESPPGAVPPPVSSYERRAVETSSGPGVAHRASAKAKGEAWVVPPESAVAGVVIDAEGRPIVGAEVTLEVLGSDALRIRPIEGPTQARVGPTVSWRTRTNREGAFLFEESKLAEGGQLYAVATGYLDTVVRRPVNVRNAHQFLHFPPTPQQDSEWIVEVLDGQGRPLDVSGAELRFLRRTQPGAIREPRRDELIMRRGEVTVRGLPPGVWELHVDVPHSLGGEVEWKVDAPRSRQRSALVLAPLEEGFLTDASLEVDVDGMPRVDPTRGLARHLEGRRVPLASRAHDGHFGATLQTGFGPALGAILELDLHALHFMCSNDTLALEFTTGGTFAWQSSLVSLMGGSWSQGTQRRLRLDLARLPKADGTFIDLRPFLADGQLDVVVQDDTSVERINLRVLR